MKRAAASKTPSLRRLRDIPRPEKVIDLQDLNPDDDWVSLRISKLEQYFNGINFKLMDESIEATVRKNTSLTRCRALDAVHLATALYFKPHHEETLTIASLDRRMRTAASDLGFKLFPEDTV